MKKHHKGEPVSIRLTERQHRGWFKSSRSSGSCNCVEVNFDLDEHSVSIRDSKYLQDATNDPAAQPIITVTADQWRAFLAELNDSKAAAVHPALSAHLAPDGAVTLRSPAANTSLLYTSGEWKAFLGGVRSGEFDVGSGIAQEQGPAIANGAKAGEFHPHLAPL